MPGGSRCRIAIFLAAAVVWALGCPHPPTPPLLDELAETAGAEVSIQWPSPPAEARIRYLGSISSEDRFEPPPSLWRRLARLVYPSRRLGFVRPAGLCVDHDRLAVADPGAGLVHVLDLYDRRWIAITTTGSRPLLSPVDVACLPDGRLVVSDSALESLWAFDSEGRPLGPFTESSLARPTGIAYEAPHERVWVAETLAHRVAAFDLRGRKLLEAGVRGIEPGRFNFPTMLASDGDGGVWVTDSLNFRLHYVDASGHPGRYFGIVGDRAGTFARPRGLAVDASGRIFAVDALFDAVQIFDREGNLLLVFGERGAAPGEFWLPADVALDGRGHVFVTDSYNRRVQVFAYRPPAEP